MEVFTFVQAHEETYFAAQNMLRIAALYNKRYVAYIEG